jgi:catechol 2,3-dioxygenase-like lactoylglutathione lyase family enzyme
LKSSSSVSDIDRAIAFYRDQVGFRLDHDTHNNEHMHVVQLTPPGSGSWSQTPAPARSSWTAGSGWAS